MYEQYFGFREPPFRITPDPRFLYRNPCVEEAAAALAYGIERRKGFISLVGEAGTGKTTLLRHVLDTLSGNVRTVVLLHPTVEFDEILEYILGELGIPIDGGRKLVLIQRLQEFLLEHTRSGGNVALLIDEAQDLEGRVLEELRLLSNLETGTEKILQIVLAGQPELELKLADAALRQLRQRIALHVRLRPLSAEEVDAYIRTRLELAGAARIDVFTTEAVARIAAVSQGIPRIVNVLCDACLVAAYATNADRVTPDIVAEAWADYSRLVGDVPAVPPPAPALSLAPTPITAAAAAVVAGETSQPVAAPEPAAPPPIPLVDAADPFLETELDTEPLPEPARSPWWAQVRIATLLLVAATVGMLALNFSLRSSAPNRDGTSLPETAVAQIPVVTDDGEPMAPPSASEARSLVHEFMLAYEARNADRLAALFAPEASDNGREGLEAIRAAYAATFASMRDVTMVVPRVETVARGDRVAVSGPVVITYRDETGGQGELRGTAEWEIALAEGTPRIVRLRHDVGPRTS
jgi:general secretion pathway protein A